MGRFQKGQSGNPAGKPPGTRHRVTTAAQELLDGEAQQLTRKAIDLALGGDMVALRLCLDRIIPPSRSRPVHFPVAQIDNAADALQVMADVLKAAADGQMTLDEASQASDLVRAYLSALETSDFEERLKALEERQIEAN